MSRVDTSPNIYSLPASFAQLKGQLRILDLRGTGIPPEEVERWREKLPGTEIRY